jgi:DNA polymerase-3 subunit gamma/tau
VATLERPDAPAARAAAPAPAAPAPSTAGLPDDLPPDDLEPPEEIEPPYESAVPEEPAGDWAAAPPEPDVEVAPERTAPQQRAAGRPAPARQAPERPAPERSAPASGARTPTFQAPQRYGEAVVREILGARFLEEQPAPPTMGMR